MNTKIVLQLGVLAFVMSLSTAGSALAGFGIWNGKRTAAPKLPCHVVIENDLDIGPSLLMSFELSEKESRGAVEGDIGMIQLTGVSVDQLKALTDSDNEVYLRTKGTAFQYNYEIQASGPRARRQVAIRQKNTDETRAGGVKISFRNGVPVDFAMQKKHRKTISGTMSTIFHASCKF